ncbi:MAG: GSCFA domain-containing protein [Mangrovibacterium sp.]
MKQYYTEVELTGSKWQLDYSDKVLFIGSCFTENIGEIMQGLKFQTCINPFGIVYNPLSVSASLRRLMAAKNYTEDDLFKQDGYWGSFDFHGRYSASNRADALSGMNRQVAEGHQFLSEAGYLVITLGTAWVFEHRQTRQIVANCHKFQASAFTRYRLSSNRIIDDFKELLSTLWKFNPNLKVLFSVSPIRHLKDGANGNQLSKSGLLLAVDQLVSEFGTERCDYFPAYEIVMDELRDYRFYAADLVHLSPVAVEHIWSKFRQHYISSEALNLMSDIEKISKAMQHRPLRRDSPAYVNFLNQNLNKLRDLTFCFPYLNFQHETEHFKNEMNGCEIF